MSSEETTTVATETENTEETTEEKVETIETEVSEEKKQETVATKEETPVRAPESYEDFSLPEGVNLNEELVNEFKPLAKELNLTQEEAQKLVNLQAKSLESLNKENEKAWSNLSEQWVKQAKEDKEIGGKDFDEKMSVAREALKEFGSDELKEALNLTGMGNHPEFLRFAYNVGKLLKEDKIETGGSNQKEPKDIAHVLFPDMA